MTSGNKLWQIGGHTSCSPASATAAVVYEPTWQGDRFDWRHEIDGLAAVPPERSSSRQGQHAIALDRRFRGMLLEDAHRSRNRSAVRSRRDVGLQFGLMMIPDGSWLSPAFSSKPHILHAVTAGFLRGARSPCAGQNRRLLLLILRRGRSAR